VEKAMTHSERILELLARERGLDDDELSRRLDIRPRQQVNSICRKLARERRVVRSTGPAGQICNFLPSDTVVPTGVKPPKPFVWHAQTAPPATLNKAFFALSKAQLDKTLILIPCSKKKIKGGAATRGCSPLTGDLPPTLGRNLAVARTAVLARAGIDGGELMPAWQRYDGEFYTAADQAPENAIKSGLHLLILSGGYGVIKACERIGIYNTLLKLRDWPNQLLQNVLLDYARCHKLKSVWAFVPKSGDYCKLVKKLAAGEEAGITGVFIVSPIANDGNQRREVPRALGEAFAAFLSGTLTQDWESSDGLRLQFTWYHLA
jgi:hypothetical protein